MKKKRTLQAVSAFGIKLSRVSSPRHVLASGLTASLFSCLKLTNVAGQSFDLDVMQNPCFVVVVVVTSRL